jgi:hypothetical protein
MDPEVIDIWTENWTKLGFEVTEMVEGKTVWKDLCIVAASGFSDHLCSWIVVNGAERIAWLAGTEAGTVVGRDNFRR